MFFVDKFLSVPFVVWDLWYTLFLLLCFCDFVARAVDVPIFVLWIPFFLICCHYYSSSSWAFPTYLFVWICFFPTFFSNQINMFSPITFEICSQHIWFTICVVPKSCSFFFKTLLFFTCTFFEDCRSFKAYCLSYIFRIPSTPLWLVVNFRFGLHELVSSLPESCFSFFTDFASPVMFVKTYIMLIY